MEKGEFISSLKWSNPPIPFLRRRREISPVQVTRDESHLSSGESWLYKRSVNQTKTWILDDYRGPISKLRLTTLEEHQLFELALTGYALGDLTAQLASPQTLSDIFMRVINFLENKDLRKATDNVRAAITAQKGTVKENHCLSLGKEPNDPLALDYFRSIENAAQWTHTAISEICAGRAIWVDLGFECDRHNPLIADARQKFLQANVVES